MADIAGLLLKYFPKEDERFFKELFNGAEYRKVRGKTDLVIIDVGALAGEFCAYIYDQAKVIYAIEPYTPHYAELAKNVDEFHLEKVKPFEIALSNSNGTGNLSNQSDRGGHRLVDEVAYRVETKTLATFMKEQVIEHVDILKIDIEGGEEKVFASEDFKEIAGKIDMIIGEHLVGQRALFEGLGFSEEIDGSNFIFRRNNG